MAGRASAANKLRRETHAALRDLAPFNTGINTMLRASDLLKLRVLDVCDHTGAIVEELPPPEENQGVACRAAPAAEP